MRKSGKTEKSKAKDSVKVRDLKPKKNPKAGQATGKRQHEPIRFRSSYD